MPKVTIYTRKTCAPCLVVKRWLDNKNIPYETRDLDQDPGYTEEAFRISGYTAVPVINIEDRGVVVGPNFARLIALLA